VRSALALLALAALAASCGEGARKPPAHRTYRRDPRCHEPIRDAGGYFFWVGCRPGYGPKNGIGCGLDHGTTGALSAAWAWRCDQVIRHDGSVDEP
jgi:hypothetical protein